MPDRDAPGCSRWIFPPALGGTPVFGAFRGCCGLGRSSFSTIPASFRRVSSGKNPPADALRCCWFDAWRLQNTRILVTSGESWEEMWEVLLRGVGRIPRGTDASSEDGVQAEDRREGRPRVARRLLFAGPGRGRRAGPRRGAWRGAAAAVHRGGPQANRRPPRTRPNRRPARYQTVYARAPGAVAAPTAGLHFTEPLLDELRAAGPRDWHGSRCTSGRGPSGRSRSRIRATHRPGSRALRGPRADGGGRAAPRAGEGRPVVAVGTTVVRTLEALAARGASCAAGAGSTDLFILPGYRFRVVTELITNFHLPRSTLLMLVAAFAGREPVLAAYRRGHRRAATASTATATRCCIRRRRRACRVSDRFPGAGPRRRTPAPGVLQTAPRSGRDAGVHAGGHAGHGQGAGRPRICAALGAQHHPRQHLSPGAAPGRGADRRGWAACTASWPGRAPSSPTPAASRSSAWRARRSVDEDGVTFRSHLDGSAQRFTPERAMAGAGRAGQRHRHGLRRMPALGRARRAWSRRRWRAPPAGPGAAWRPRRRRASCASASCRAGSTWACGALTSRRSPPLPFEGLALGGLGVGEPPPVMHEVVARGRPEHAGRSAALPDGRGAPRGSAGTAIARRHRHVRLRDAHPQRAQRPAVRARAAGSTSATASTARPTAPVEEGCPCETCRSHSRAYLAHLFHAKETAVLPAGDHAQPAALPGSGARRARGHPGGGLDAYVSSDGRLALRQAGIRPRAGDSGPSSGSQRIMAKRVAGGAVRMRRWRRQRDPRNHAHSAGRRAGRSPGDLRRSRRWPREGCSITAQPDRPR